MAEAMCGWAKNFFVPRNIIITVYRLYNRWYGQSKKNWCRSNNDHVFVWNQKNQKLILEKFRI